MKKKRKWQYWLITMIFSLITIETVIGQAIASNHILWQLPTNNLISNKLTNEINIDNKDLIFDTTSFNAPTTTKLTKTTISYTDPKFKTIFSNCTNGYTVDFNKDIEAKQTQLKDYMNNNISTFFNNSDNITIQVSNVVITIDTSTNSAIAAITYNGFNSNNTYNENNQATITIYLKPTYESRSSDQTNLLKGINKYINDKVQQENNGIFPNNNLLKDWVVQYLNQAKVKDNLFQDCLPSSGLFRTNDINIDIKKIDKSKNPIIIQAGAITTINVNTPLSLPEISINISITDINNEGLIDVSNSSISNIVPEQIVQDQNDTNSLTMIYINNFLNQQKHQIFTNLPKDAIISIVPNSVVLNKDRTLTLKIQASSAVTLEGLEPNKQFSASMCGLSQAIFNNTSLVITNINYQNQDNKKLFKNIWWNDKGYAVDWACLTPEQIDEKKNQLIDYINDNVDIFFENTINASRTPIVSSVSFNFNNIRTNIVVITINYRGYQNNAIKENLKGTIELQLQPTSGPDSDMYKIFGPDGIVQASIKSWVDKYPKRIPTKKELEKIVSDALDQPINPNNANSSTFSDLLPLSYSPSAVINTNKINLSGDRLRINSGAIQFIPKIDTPSTGINGNWGKIQNITSPNFQILASESNIVNKENNSNLWIWIVIILSITALTIFVIWLAIIVTRTKDKKHIQY